MKRTPQRCQDAIQHLGGGGLKARVGVRDHRLDAAQAAARERAHEFHPEGLGLRGADRHGEHLATAIAVDRDRDDQRHRDDALLLAHLDVGRVEPDIGQSPSRGRASGCTARPRRDASPHAVALAVALIEPIGAAFAVHRTGQTFDLELHQALRRKADHPRAAARRRRSFSYRFLFNQRSNLSLAPLRMTAPDDEIMLSSGKLFFTTDPAAITQLLPIVTSL